MGGRTPLALSYPGSGPLTSRLAPRMLTGRTSGFGRAECGALAPETLEVWRHPAALAGISGLSVERTCSPLPVRVAARLPSATCLCTRLFATFGRVALEALQEGLSEKQHPSPSPGNPRHAPNTGSGELLYPDQPHPKECGHHMPLQSSSGVELK